MKKFLKPISRSLPALIVIGLLAMFSLPLAVPEASAALGPVVSIQDVTLEPGESTTVPIELTDFTDLAGLTVKLAWDEALADVTNVTDGDLGEDTLIMIGSYSGSPAEFTGASFVGHNGDFDFVYVTLQARSLAGSCALNLTVVSCANTELSTIVPSVIDGTLTVPKASDVWVNDSWGDQGDVDAYDDSLAWQYNAFDTIQDGIDNVTGSTVNVLPGTYSAFNVTGWDDLTISAESGAVVNTTAPFSGSGENINVMGLINNSTNISIDGLEFDGSSLSNTEPEYGIFSLASTASFTDLSVHNLDSDHDSEGVGIGVAGGLRTADISECTITGCEVGVYVEDDTVNVSDCTITGMSSASFVSLGIWAGSGAVVNAESCDISNYVVSLPPSSDPGPPDWGGNGVGVVVGNGATVVLDCCNKIHDNDYGIWVESGADCTANGNSIYSNTYYGLYYGLGQPAGEPEALGVAVTYVDALLNWWGDPTGPEAHDNNPDGAGDVVSGNVTFEPWLMSWCPSTDTSATSTEDLDEGDTVSAGAASATATSGSGIVTVAEYVENPSGSSFYGDTGTYIDVYVPSPTDIDELLVKLYYDEGDLDPDVDEDTLAMYWWDGDDWSRCSSTGVETAADYIWARITGGSFPSIDDLGGTFFGGGAPEPEEEEEAAAVGLLAPPESANFVASYMKVSPQQVLPGQEVEISINIANHGGESGAHNVALFINGYVEQSQTISVSPGAARLVVFRTSKTVPGTYEVSMEGAQGQFIVLDISESTAQPAATGGGGLGKAGIVTIVIIALAFIVAIVFIFRSTSRP